MIKLNGSVHAGSSNDIAPDLTPMLDILFILLVFFILTAGAVAQSLEMTLPSNVSEELDLIAPKKHIMVEIRTQDYAVDGKKIVKFSDLQSTLLQNIEKHPDHDVIIAGDKSISIERLLAVLTYLQSRGIQAANILMHKDIQQ